MFNYEKLNEIMQQLGHTESHYSREDYVIAIEELYTDIYNDIEDDRYSMYFKEDYPFMVKALIVEYLNYENSAPPSNLDTDTSIRINKQIDKAIKTLEKYPQANASVNPFIDPSPKYEAYTLADWKKDKKKQFIDRAASLQVKEYIAEKILLGLDTI